MHRALLIQPPAKGAAQICLGDTAIFSFSLSMLQMYHVLPYCPVYKTSAAAMSIPVPTFSDSTARGGEGRGGGMRGGVRGGASPSPRVGAQGCLADPIFVLMEWVPVRTKETKNGSNQPDLTTLRQTTRRVCQVLCLDFCSCISEELIHPTNNTMHKNSSMSSKKPS